MAEEEELHEYLRQLAEVKTKLLKKPNDADLLSLKQELEEIIELTRGLIEEQAAERKSAVVAPPPPPPPAGAQAGHADERRVGISQAAKRYVSSEVTELSGWRVGDRCRTIFLGDGKKYPAVVSTLKPESKSAVVTFVKYLNQQDTPILFLERVVEEEAAAAAAEAGAAEAKGQKKDGGKKKIEIKATDAPEVVERKKRLLKKQKREEKTAEKEKAQNSKINSWQSFQNASASRPPASTAAALVAASKFKGTTGAASGSDGAAFGESSAKAGAKGVRTRWDRGQQHDEE